MIAIYYSQELDKGGVAHTYDTLWSETFAPVDWDIVILDRLIACDTYKLAKEIVRGQAIRYSNIQGNVPMAWSEVAEIGNWFEKYGRRYGLLTEFRENGIC